MNRIVLVNRRGFLKRAFSAGALVLGVRVGPAGAAINNDVPPVGRPSVYLGIETDGSVIILATRSEMGQGVRTSLPLTVADELDADLNKVRVRQAIGDPRYGRQDTDGSRSIRDFFIPMREAGAAARLMLIQAAAQHWGVAANDCATELHTVVCRRTGQRLGYGKLATAAAKLAAPKSAELRLKPRSSWRYIGKGTPSYDRTAICTGQAIYGMDVRAENMVYASIEHPPVFGGRLKSYDDTDALKVPGVLRTATINAFRPPAAYQPLGGVAVIAGNTWAAFNARKRLKIFWENGENEAFNSDEYRKELQDTVHKPGKVLRNEGDVDTVFAKGGKIVEADYYVPLLAQAPMEPMVALAEFRNGKVKIWAPVQNPQAVQDIVSKELGVGKEDVICNVTLLGGGFGRKDQPDFVVEAAVLSKQLGRPVKVVWTREDDIKFGYYNAVAAMYMKAVLGDNGMPNAWLQRVAFPPIPSTFELNAVYGDFPHLSQGWIDVPFAVPNLRVENGPAKAHVRIGWMRSVASIYEVFAVQSFADELAHIVGRDSLDFLLELIGEPRILNLKNTNYANYGAPYDLYPIDTGRLRRVTEMVAEKAGWSKRRPGKRSGLGIAANQNSLTYVATVVEVNVDDEGDIRIPRVDTVVDAGTIVNPELARAQVEGGAVFGASIVLSGEITVTHGVIDQSNFYDYRVARVSDAPHQTNVYFVDSDARPTGLGEPAVPAFIAAFCNAIFAATGKRIRSLPVGDQKLI